MTDPLTTHHVYPPIPDRRFDWAAYRDPEGAVGRGPTEADAIRDFLQNEDPMYDEPHWTDDAPSPRFSTVIRAAGPQGNIYAILGAACSLLAQLEIPADRIERLRADVGTAQSYDAAVACVEAWFPVERG